MKSPYFLLLALCALFSVVCAWEKEDHEIFDLVSALQAAEGAKTSFCASDRSRFSLVTDRESPWMRRQLSQRDGQSYSSANQQSIQEKVARATVRTHAKSCESS